MKIPVANFEPDKSRFNAGALPDILNVLPVVDGWAPMPKPVDIEPITAGPYTGVVDLPEPCLNAWYVRTSLGTERYFAFGSTRIYEFDQNEGTWLDVGRGADYNAYDLWSICVFGSRLYAQNGVDLEQSIDIETGLIFEDNPLAPISRFIAVVGDFMVRGAQPSVLNKLQWSGLNDPFSNEIGVDGADYQIFPEGEEIMGIIPMSFGAIIALKSAFYSMNFALSSEYVFTFQNVTKFRGTYSPYSITSINNDDFVIYCTDGFFRGDQFASIGENRVNRWLQAEMDPTFLPLIQAMPDSARNIVWFKYRNNAGEYRFLGYDWNLDRWCHSDIAAQVIFRARSFSLNPDETFDGPYATATDFDNANIAFDSLSFNNGVPQVGIITVEGHLAFLTGENHAATVTTNELSLNDVNRAFINNARLDGDAVNVVVTPFTGEYKGSALIQNPDATPSLRTRFIALRADGRIHQFSLNFEEGETWSIVSGLDVDVKQSGSH